MSSISSSQRMSQRISQGTEQGQAETDGDESVEKSLSLKHSSISNSAIAAMVNQTLRQQQQQQRESALSNTGRQSDYPPRQPSHGAKGSEFDIEEDQRDSLMWVDVSNSASLRGSIFW
jgi:hypothetical protein